jgi:hypothetical protein
VTTVVRELDPTRDSPHDVVVALLGLTAQYRELLGDGSPEQVERLLARSGPGSWSALDYVAHVAELLHSTSKRLLLLFEQPGREVSPPHLEAVSATARGANPRLVLAALGTAAEGLAHVVDEADPGAWRLSARRCGATVTAGELVGEALGEARRHLEDATEALALATA